MSENVDTQTEQTDPETTTQSSGEAAGVAHGGDRPSSVPGAIEDVPVEVSVVLGKTTMKIRDIKGLTRGAVIPIDRDIGEWVDVYVNDRRVARGVLEVIDKDEGRMGVNLTEIINDEG